jgi:hypothetical protein
MANAGEVRTVVWVWRFVLLALESATLADPAAESPPALDAYGCCI